MFSKNQAMVSFILGKSVCINTKRERQTDRQRHRQTEIERQSKREIEGNRKRARAKERQREKERDRDPEMVKPLEEGIHPSIPHPSSHPFHPSIPHPFIHSSPFLLIRAFPEFEAVHASFRRGPFPSAPSPPSSWKMSEVIHDKPHIMM